MMKHRGRSYWRFTILITLLFVSFPAASNGAAPAAPQSSSAQRSAALEAAQAAEDVTVLKALDAVALTRPQLAQLLPSLRGAQERLTQFEAQEAAKLAAHRAPLERAKRDLLSGKGSGLGAQERFNIALTTLSQRRAGVRVEVVSSLRRTLASILSPAQAASLVESGKSVLRSQRSASRRGGSGRNSSNPNDAANAFVDRYLLSPRAPEAVAARLTVR